MNARVEGLTDREKDVLRLLCDGLPNKLIAHRLGLSPRTVEIHRLHIGAKTGAKSPVQLGVWAARNGFAGEPS